MPDLGPPAGCSPDELRKSRLAWLAIAILILVQFSLFRQQVVREILPTYPAYYDQARFLQLAQETYQSMMTRGFWSGLFASLNRPQPASFMLPIQGGLAYYIFGPHRFNALALTFAYFALLQVTVAYTVRRITGRWSMGLVAVGLLVGTASRFLYAGGLDDFRADSIAASLYGVTLCCFLLSDWLADRQWRRLTVLSAALLCWFRPIAGVYLAGTHLVLLLFLLLQIRRSPERPRPRQAVRNLGKCSLVLTALSAPMLFFGARILYDYYGFGHVFGPEKNMRAIEQGVNTLTDNLLYYPRTLYDFHLGPPVVYLWLFLLGAASLLVVLSKLGSDGGAAARSHADGSEVSWGVLILWFVTPLAILTANLSKSPVVASIVVAPAVLLATFALARILFALPAPDPSSLTRFAGAALAVASIIPGMTLMANAEARSRANPAEAAGAAALMPVFDAVAHYCKHFGITRLKLSVDRTIGYFNRTVTSVMLFERAGLNVAPEELLSYDIYARQIEAAKWAATEADCAVLTLDPPEKAPKSLFPFDQSAARWQEAYRDVVTSSMIPVAKLDFPNHSFQVFLRPRVRLEGASFGWLTADGVRIFAPARVLQAWPVVRLSGATVGSKYLKGPLGTTVTLIANPGNPDRAVPSRATIAADESYEIQIDTSGIHLPDSGLVQLRLMFDRYFVPQEVGTGADPRRLVIQSPRSTRMTAGTDAPIKAAPPQLSLRDLYP